MRRLAILAAAMAVLVSLPGCGDDVIGDNATTAATAATTTTLAPPTTETTEAPPPPPPPPPTTAATTTTAAPATTVATTTTAATTTTMAATTTTVAPSGGPYVVNESDFFPDPLPGSAQAAGSGCAPGGTVLPDGIWFGFVEAYAPGTITFDLACFFTGAVAEAKAIEDGEEAFDFYIRNQNPNTRSVPVATTARVWFVDITSPDVLFPDEIPLASWPHPDSFQVCPATWCSVWLYVNGGEVTGLVEQYLP